MPNSYAEQDQLAFYEAINIGFDRAASCVATLDRYFRIADRIVLLKFVGPALTPHIIPALAHLETEPVDSGQVDFTVRLFDSKSTQTPMPVKPVWP